MKARLNRIKSFRIIAVAAALVAAVFVALPAQAATFTWDNGSGDFAWSNTSGAIDWTGSAWSNGNDALFAGTGIGTVSLGGPISANSISFTAPGYTISGNTLTLGTGGINASTLTSGTTTIGRVFAATGVQRWSVGAGATLALTAIGAGADASDLYTPNGAIVFISKTGTVTTTDADGWGWRGGAVAGTGLLGPGTVIDNGDNTYDWASVGTQTAGTSHTIVAPTYTTAVNSADAHNVKVTSNTTVSVNNSWASLLVSGATFTANGSNLYVDTGIILQNNATINGAAAIKSNADGLYVYVPDSGTITSSIQNNGSNVKKLYKAGPGTLTLTGANSYTGNTVIYDGTLAFNYGTGANVTFASSISGSGAVNLTASSGTPRVHFSGTNTYSGATTIGANVTLEVNASAAYSPNSDYTVNGAMESYDNIASATIGALNGGGTIYNTGDIAGTTTFTVGANGHSGTFSGAIANGAWGSRVTALVKTGTGTQILSGINRYSGLTTISAGTLALGPAGTLGSGGLTITAGGVLDVSAYGSGYNFSGGALTAGRTAPFATDINGSINVNTTTVNWPASNATITISGSLAASGATFNYYAGDQIALSSALSLSSTDYITPLAPLGTGSYTLFTTPAGGVSPSATANLAMAGVNGSSPRQTYTFDASSGSAVVLNVAGQAGNLFWTGAGGGGWFTGAGAQNWYNTAKPGGAGGDVFYASDAVTFSDSGGGTASIGAVVISGTVAPGAMTVSNTAVAYTISGTGSIVGGTSLAMNGPGSLTINNSNTYSGGTNIFGGTLIANSANALGLGTVTLSGGKLNLASAAALGNCPLTLSSGSLDNVSGSAMTLSNNNTQTWSGGFTFVGSNPLNMGAGAVNLSASSTVVVNANTLTVDGAINGTGALTKNGPGILVLTGNNGYGGGTTISNGTLQIGNSGTTNSLAGGSVVDNGVLYFNINANLTAGNSISGTGSVIVGGGNRLHINGTNTYSGATTINSGSILEVNASAAYSQYSDYTVNGTLEAYADTYLSNVAIGALNGSGKVYNTANHAGTTGFTLGANGDSGDFSGTIYDGAWGSNKTALTKSGSGTQVISGTNAYTGNTTVNEGTLTIGPSGQLYTNGGAGALYINSGGLVSVSGDVGWTWAGGPYAAFGGMTPDAAHLVINGGTLQHTGASNSQNQQPGAGRVFSVGANGATIDSATAGQMFSLGWRYDYSGGVIGSSNGGTLTLTGAGDGQLDFALPGGGGLVKNGTGKWILSGPNTYTGGTTINGGVLQMVINGTRIGSLGNQGPLTMSSGTLDLNGINQTVGALAGTGGVITTASPAALNSISSTNTTFSGALVGSVSLAVTGGQLTLGGANSHTGGSTFNGVAVTLVPGGSLGPGLTSLNTGSTLDVSAFASGYPLSHGTLATDYWGTTVTGSLVVGSATLAPLGTMTVSDSLSLNGATFTFTPGVPITSNVLSLSGTNYIAPTTSLAVGTQYELFGYSGADPVTTGLRLAGQYVSGRQVSTFAAATGQVSVTISAGDAGVLTWQGTALNHKWDVQASTDWYNANTSAADKFYSGDHVTFDDAADPSGGTVTIVGTVQPSSISVSSNTVNYTFSGTGSIGNGTALNMSGVSTLTIATSNVYTGGTSLANGVINANAPYALGLGTVSVSSGTLNLTAGTASGPGAITVSGGVVNASAPQVPSSITLNGGQINVNDPHALGSGVLTINAFSTLDNTSSGSVVSATNNQQQWNGDFTFAGTKPLDLGNGLINLNNSVTVTVSGSTLSAEGSIAALSDGLGLTVAGSGTLSLDGVADNGGGGSRINVQGATLNIGPNGRLNIGNYGTITNVTNGGKLRVTNGVGWNSTLGLADLGTGGLVLDGGTFTHYGSSNYQNAGDAGRLFTIGANGATLESETPGQTFSIGFRYDRENSTITSDGGALTLTGAGNGELNYGVPGTGALIKNGGGTWKLSGPAANSYNGGTIINEGVLQVGKASALGDASGSLTVNSGTLDLNGYNPVVGDLSGAAGVIATSSTGSSALTVGTANSTTFSGTIVDGAGHVGLIKQGDGVLTLQGSNTHTGGTTVAGGVLQVANVAALGGPSGSLIANGGTLDLNGFSPTVGDLSGGSAGLISTLSASSTLTVGTANSTTFSGTIVDGASLVSLVKQGTGMLTLAGTNTYTGGTTVLDGTLVLNNNEAIADGTSLTVGDPSLFLAPIVPPTQSAAIAAPAIAAVPEPGSLALVAAGALAAAGCLWRRRKAART